MPEECENAAVSSHYYLYNINEAELLPLFLGALLKSEEILAQVKTFVKGTTSYAAIRGNDFLEVEIPLPSLDEQNAIVAQIEKQKAIIEGADLVLKNWEVDETIFAHLSFSELDKHLNFVSSGATPLGGSNVYTHENGVLFIRSQNVLINKTDFSDAVLIPNDVHQKMKRTQVKKGDVFLNITGASIGRSALMNEDIEANVNQHVAILRPNETLLPEYLSAVLNTPNLQNQIDKLQTGSSRQGLNFDQIKKLIIPITGPVSQLQIVENLNAQLQILNGISKMKTEAQNKINRILADVWGVELTEPVLEEVETDEI